MDVENQELLDELERVREILDLGFNPVPREQMHITLEFFKDASEQELDMIKDAIDSADTGSFSTRMNGVGAFPSLDYIRVVWAGVESGRFHELYSEVSSHGVEADSKNDFSPHVTLMRVKDLSSAKKKKLQKAVREFSDHYFGELSVDELKLYESSLGPEGPEYRVIHRREL